ncbi:MAG: hypothetical protein GX999_09680 [Bacteroidales bacterium]|jgi:hypothetical protein|nr:hypothetical protein [Bacteroidales bacterium]
MSNRQFTVRSGESETLNEGKSNDWGSLVNRFSGERLFKYNYFNIICGDLSSVTTTKNKWFTEYILKAGSEGDPNLLPVIKKIVADTSLNESLRQRASEISENLEEIDFSVTEAKFPDLNEEKKILAARRMLVGIRMPRTSEILRLLKDNSIAVNRIALFMVGKFRIISLIPEVCEALTTEGLEGNAVSVLQSFGTEAESELFKCYFKYSGNPEVCTNILWIFNKNASARSISFSFEMLWATSRKVREMALVLLLDNKYKPSSADRNRLFKLLFETAGIIADLISADIVFRKNNKNHLADVINKECSRWKFFFAGIYSLMNNQDSIIELKDKTNTEMPDFDKHANNLAAIILGRKRNFPLISLGKSTEERKFRKLNHYFNLTLPSYDELCEKIINYNYNSISVWTKACLIRELDFPRNKAIEDSVIALLFGSEELLQEEAARLLSASGSENYSSVLQRIPENTRSRIGKIGFPVYDNEAMLFEKTRFLAKLFGGIPEDELLMLASRMKFIRNSEKPFNESKCLVWTLFPGNINPDVIILNHSNQSDISGKIKGADLYILSLESVDVFHRHFPEHSFEILKYIDENE